VAGGYAVIAAVVLALGWLITDAGVFAGVRAWDDDVVRWVAEHRAAWLDDWVLRVGRMADTIPVVAAAVVVEVVLLVRRRFLHLLVLAIGLGVELFAFLLANYVIGRPRPDVVKVGEQPGTYSYPSGHIAATIVLWGGIAALLLWHHRRTAATWIAAVVVALAAVAVGFTRIYRGMHHPTDVLVGAALGLAALALAILTVRFLERRRAEVPT
jgi:undecaprenyl-diphosphatase